MGRLELIVDYAVKRVKTAVGYVERGAGNAVQSLGNVSKTCKAGLYGVRQEVPFERWFCDHDFANPIKDSQDLMKARLWAVFAVLEGALRIVAEAATILYLRVFEPDDKKEVKHHLDILNIQCQSLQLSLLAIVSPNEAKKKALDSKENLITRVSQGRKWGTLYSGKMDIFHL